MRITIMRMLFRVRWGGRFGTIWLVWYDFFSFSLWFNEGGSKQVVRVGRSG